MRKLTLFLVLLCCVSFLVTPALAANKVRAFVALIGGGVGALDKVGQANFEDGDISIVVVTATQVFYVYVYDADGEEAESPPDTIRPDDYDVGVHDLVFTEDHSGFVTAVLDCASGDCDDLIDAPGVFVDGDTDPDVSGGAVFITANTGATTIADFDTELTNGKMIFVIVNDANTTFDFTASGLEGTSANYTAANGELLIFIYATADSKWHYAGFPKTFDITIGGLTATRPVYSDGSGNLTAGDNGGDIEITGDDLEIKTDAVDYDETSGSIKSLTPVSAASDDFAANFTGANLYGGTFVSTSDGGDAQLPEMVAGMNFCIITETAHQVVVASHANDGYLLDGTTTAEDNSVVNGSAAGDIACFQYYTADDWLITTNGWSTE